jgi:hypothetical protein
MFTSLLVYKNYYKGNGLCIRIIHNKTPISCYSVQIVQMSGYRETNQRWDINFNELEINK